jgi:hypothetical protein
LAKGVSKMRTMNGLVALVVAGLLLALTMSSVAFARVDELGGTYFSAAPYAPYTAGPVVPEVKGPYAAFSAVPYAPYTAGPVVREVKGAVVAYAPYTAGPVVREVKGGAVAYAPYTAGPVVREVKGPYAAFTASPSGPVFRLKNGRLTRTQLIP